MKRRVRRTGFTLLLLFGLTLFRSISSGQDGPRPLPELSSFVQQVRKTLRSDRLLLSQYTYLETGTERQLDKSGKIRKTEVEIAEVYPSLEEELTYRKLISKNGQPLAPKELDKQDRAHDRKLEQRGRAHERDKRPAQQAEERRKEQEVVDEVLQLYRISILAREIRNGTSTIMLAFDPRPDRKPRSREAKILSKVAGRAWFGEKDHQLARIEADLIDNISFGFGVLARMNKGAHLVIERRRINDEIWLPASTFFSGTGRLLLFKGLRMESLTEYSDYRKFTVETSVGYSAEKDQ